MATGRILLLIERRAAALTLLMFVALAMAGCSGEPDAPVDGRDDPATHEETSTEDPVHESLVTGDADKQAEADVRDAWAEFKEASLSGKGEVAANRVTKTTIEYYDEIRRLALEASREELGAHVFAKRLTVLGVRLRMSAEQLRNMTGRELFIHTVDQGWIGKTSASDEDVGIVKVTGDHARAGATKGGRPTLTSYHFVKEDGLWRLDMMQLMKTVNPAFDEMVKNSGLSEEDFTKRSLEAITGKTVTDELWNPPGAESEP